MRSEILESGREAFGRRDWARAHADLAAADREQALDAEDLERLARAAYLVGNDDESSELWQRAHEAFLAADETVRAARCAFWLGFGLLQRGRLAPGGGWLGRAQRVLDEYPGECEVHGYLLVPRGLQQMGSGDAASAFSTFEQAHRIGARADDPDLRTLGLLGQGQALLRDGDTAGGVALFDEAMVSVVADEVSAVVSGIVYCAVVDECQEIFDVRRAQEWTAALSRWCESQPDLVPYRGQCLVHRAQLMQMRGDWHDAMHEARRARERLSRQTHPAVGMAYYQLGELHRLRGYFDAAEAAYRDANESGRDPHPGLAQLRLAQGRIADAAAAIEAAVGDASDHVSRSKMLPACVEIMTAAGRMDAARAADAELTKIAADAATPLLDALAAHAHGAVLLAEGDPKAAIESLRRARRIWKGLDAPFDAARTQWLIGRACRALGDGDTAEVELDAARAVFEELGASPEVVGLDVASRNVEHDRSGLTRRELEVLAHVAAGETNREIADALAISEKTVARHVSNIFTKLDVSSRSAATAYAYEHDLLGHG